MTYVQNPWYKFAGKRGTVWLESVISMSEGAVHRFRQSAVQFCLGAWYQCRRARYSIAGKRCGGGAWSRLHAGPFFGQWFLQTSLALKLPCLVALGGCLVVHMHNGGRILTRERRGRSPPPQGAKRQEPPRKKRRALRGRWLVSGSQKKI